MAGLQSRRHQTSTFRGLEVPAGEISQRQSGFGALRAGSAGCFGAEPLKYLHHSRHSLDSALPVSEVQTLSEIVSTATAQRRFQMQLTACFGFAALLLALIGIYGVVSYNVEQRKGELGCGSRWVPGGLNWSVS